MITAGPWTGRCAAVLATGVCREGPDFWTHAACNDHDPNYHAFVVPAPQPPADATTESRSVQRRKAAQKSEPAPTFAAGPPVTGDGDAARDYDGSLADSYNWADRTPQECLAAARAIERDAHAAGLARGRALGAREEREVFVEALPAAPPVTGDGDAAKGAMPWPKPACSVSLPCGGCFTRGICDQLMWESGEAAGLARGRALGAREADDAWEAKLGPLLVHEGCSCDEDTEAAGFELCFASRVQNVINERIEARRAGRTS